MDPVQKQENIVFEGHRSTFWIKMQFGIGHPPPTHQLQGEGSRVPNLQTEFNYLDSFKSYGIFSDFVVPMVPMLSPLSPHCPRHPCVIPIAPRRSPWLWSPWSSVVSMVSTPCCPRGPAIIPTSSPSSPHHPHRPHIIPIASRRSPWLWSLLSPWSAPHVVPVVPVVPMLSPSSPCCPHVI